MAGHLLVYNLMEISKEYKEQSECNSEQTIQALELDDKKTIMQDSQYSTDYPEEFENCYIEGQSIKRDDVMKNKDPRQFLYQVFVYSKVHEIDIEMLNRAVSVIGGCVLTPIEIMFWIDIFISLQIDTESIGFIETITKSYETFSFDGKKACNCYMINMSHYCPSLISAISWDDILDSLNANQVVDLLNQLQNIVNTDPAMWDLILAKQEEAEFIDQLDTYITDNDITFNLESLYPSDD